MEKDKHPSYFFDAMTFFIIPLYTLFLASYDSLISSNLSVVANYFGKQNAFTLWGLMIIFYFHAYFQKITANCGLHSPALRRMVNLACILLLMGITTPYLPEQLPLKSKLHVVFAFMASLCLLASLYMLTIQIGKIFPKLYHHYLCLLITLTVLCGILLLLIGIVSSLLEILFTISTSFYLRSLYTATPYFVD